MSGTGLLAAISVLLACAAVREVFAAGSRTSPRLPALPGFRTRPVSAALRLGVPERITRAGLAGRLPTSAVLFAKLASAAFGGIASLAASAAAPGRLSIVVAVAMPAAGFMAPDAWLERQARHRRRRLVIALPDALDLLAVGAASGRDPATGFAEVAAGVDGPLAAELRTVVADVSCGIPTDRALDELRARVPGNEIAALCATIERSRRLGSPLADQLRRQAGSLRRDQHRATEERAARAAPKIQLVVALVLVPSVLLMIVAGLVANADRLLAGF